MNAIILNGGPKNGRGEACRKIKEAAEKELRSRGWAIKSFDLDGMLIKPCRGCFACWLKHPGTCAIKDEEIDILKTLVASDAMILITPVTFGGFSSALKKALDRFIPNLLPFFIKTNREIHHPQRYEKRRKLLALGTLPKADAEAERIFRGLVQRNALNVNPLRTDTGIVYEHADELEVAACVNDIIRAAEINERRAL